MPKKFPSRRSLMVTSPMERHAMILGVVLKRGGKNYVVKGKIDTYPTMSAGKRTIEHERAREEMHGRRSGVVGNVQHPQQRVFSRTGDSRDYPFLVMDDDKGLMIDLTGADDHPVISAFKKQTPNIINLKRQSQTILVDFTEAEDHPVITTFREIRPPLMVCRSKRVKLEKPEGFPITMNTKEKMKISDIVPFRPSTSIKGECSSAMKIK